jgi:small subunit ribosomal protein S16
MLAIKLQKIGRKHQPSFRLVVAEKRSKLISPPIEDLGSFQPSTKTLTCNRDRVLYWIGKGAQPTNTAHNILVKNGVIPGPKRSVKAKNPPPPAPKSEAPVAPLVAETPVVEETPVKEEAVVS